jgi:carbon monoxide dehydrogenase subunit G
MKIENVFEVPAPPEAAWALLNDVPRVVPCMPGAELVEVVDENTFKVKMHVKLGAVSLRMATDVRREQVDEAAWSTVLVATARDEKGRGGATATIRSTLEPTADGTRVAVDTDLRMQGTLASMGRGIVGAVASELVAQFADRLAGELRQEDPALAEQSHEPAEKPSAAPVKAVGGFGLLLGALLRRLRPRRG